LVELPVGSRRGPERLPGRDEKNDDRQGSNDEPGGPAEHITQRDRVFRPQKCACGLRRPEPVPRRWMAAGGGRRRQRTEKAANGGQDWASSGAGRQRRS